MEQLVEALQTAATLYASDKEVSAPESEKPWMSRPLPWPFIEDVVTAIDQVPEILALTRMRQLSLGSSEGNRLYARILASALVRRTHALRDAGKTIQELLDLVAADTGYARIVMVLAGVQTASPVELSHGVQLVPFKDLVPPSWIKDFSEKRLWPLSRAFEPVAPSAALVLRVKFSPLFTAEDKVEGIFPEREIAQLQTITHCIALAAESSADILKVWYEDDDPRLPLLSSGVAFSSSRWGGGAAASYEIDSERVRAIVTSYQRFHGDRSPIDTAMARLARAWSGWGREERAIDLGIGLEAILMYSKDRRSDDNNEISYKLSLRAAWLMGATPVERLALFKRFRRLYQLRSQAAHSGAVKTKPDAWRALDEEIEAGIALAGRILIYILQRGAWPDWDELVVGWKL